MFSGLVQEVGTVESLTVRGLNAQITVKTPTLAAHAHLGDSIAVNGVCLTVTRADAHSFDADMMAETLRRTTLGGLTAGSAVNLEPALAVGDRFGGHIVSGHIDDVGRVIRITPEGDALRIRLASTPAVHRLIIPQGSVALDGVSLTVAAVAQDHSWFEVSIIAHTQQATTLAALRVGDRVNVENDVVGKYVQALVGPYQPSGVTEQLLKDSGF